MEDGDDASRDARLRSPSAAGADWNTVSHFCFPTAGISHPDPPGSRAFPSRSKRRCVFISVVTLVVIVLIASSTARADATQSVTPEEWSRLALAPCAATAERRRDTDRKLANHLAQSLPSKEQSGFLRRELEARRVAASRQRTAALARIDALLLGAKIRITDLNDKRIGHGESLRALLEQLFDTADPCALDALESTVLFAVFGMPFDSTAVEDIGAFREFPAITATLESHLAEGRSLEDIFVAMRPPQADAAFQYIDAVARAVLDTSIAGSPLRLSPRARDHRFRQLLETVRLAAEPVRVNMHLHTRIEEMEGALGTPVPSSTVDRLVDRAENALFHDAAAMERLKRQSPFETLRLLEPVLDKWFRKDALRDIRSSLSSDPFVAYWFFVQSGATAGSGPVFSGSHVSVQPVLELDSLRRLGFDDALRRFDDAKVPKRFVDHYAELERAFTNVTLSRDEIAARVEASTLTASRRAKLHEFIRNNLTISQFSAIDLYTIVVRDASKIEGHVDWPVLKAALDLLHEAKRDRVSRIVSQIVGSEPEPDPRLRSYLTTAGGLMMELEHQQLENPRFQQRTSGAFVGWLLGQFLVSGGVPVELWAPGGLMGEEFSQLIDSLTPKNPDSGNAYRGKPADEVRLVHEGREYREAVVRLIDTAQRFINVSAFDWKTDDGGRDIAYRLMGKTLGIDGSGYARFLNTFGDGLPIEHPAAPRIAFFDIPTTRMKDLLVWFFFLESNNPSIVEAREAARAGGASLRCDAVMTCGDLDALFEQAGTRYGADLPPESKRAWHAYQLLEGLFAEKRPELAAAHPRHALRDYVEDPDALRRLIRRYGLTRRDRGEPLSINIIADAKQTVFNMQFGEHSDYFPYFASDPIRDIYFPLLEFNIRLVLWKGPMEFPWHVGAVPVPGRKILGLIPMPFIPYPWLSAVPGFGSLGPVTCIFLQYLLASDPRIYWAMVVHTKSWSNETMALESGMGMGSKYFNLHDDYLTWHDMGVAVQGAPVGDVNDHFVQVFNEARVNNTGIPSSRGVKVPALRYDDYRYASQSIDSGGDNNGTERTWLLTTHPERGDSNYRGVFLAALAAAQRNIFIENSFFSDPLVARMLIRKAREFRGRVSCEGLTDIDCARRKRDAVAIHLVLPDASDKPIVDAVGTADFHEMLHLGIKIHRWGPTHGWSATRMLHTKAWLMDYEPGRGGLAYVGAANATQRSHLADNEAGILTVSPTFAREIYERLFAPDIEVDSRLESLAGFDVAWSSSLIIRASKWLRKILVDLFWFI